MTISTLLLALLPTVFRAKPERDAERDAAMAELEHAWQRVEALQGALNAERERASLWRAEVLRLTSLLNLIPPLPLREGGWHEIGQHAQNAMAQYAQDAQMAQPHCDCSPSRFMAMLNAGPSLP